MIPYTDVQKRILDEVNRYAPALQEVQMNERAMASMMLLIAEDNPINQKLAIMQVRKLGYQAEAVADGHEALTAMETGRYALVLMDWQMPGMDGLRATAAIREMEAQTVGRARTPIIAMTANAMEGDRERCLAAGMDDYLAKPVRLAELSAVLARWTELVTS